tara:strand:+ start:6047 stop:7120 length:1074 start_codon:yes stop_codon:yes gene_type:complete
MTELCSSNKKSKMIYNELNDLLKESDKIRTNIPYTIDSLDFNVKYTPSANNLFDVSIRNQINNYINYLTQLKFVYKNIFFTINIYTEKYINVLDYFKKIQLAIILSLTNNADFDYKIDFMIDLFYTKLKKKWPKHLETIKSQHINSGFSKFNENMYICIYREEEWLKSLIQELLYSFSLELQHRNIDFTQIFSKIFNINAIFLLHDSIIDFWSRIINIAFITYYTNNKNSYEQFSLNLEREKIFSILQANKLLSIYDTTYENILNIDEIPINKLYKEETNAFSYYVLTSILINDFDRTINWLDINKNNIFNLIKSEKDIVIFTYYIVNILNNKKILNLYKNPKCQKYISSAKMTIFK